MDCFITLIYLNVLPAFLRHSAKLSASPWPDSDRPVVTSEYSCVDFPHSSVLYRQFAYLYDHILKRGLITTEATAT